jgi:two-component system phosphate regulon sensor histidine kinase PhoR
MKLETVVSKPKKGLWIAIFFICLAIVGVMATSYNVEIVNNLRARQFELETPWSKIVLGSLGFFGILAALVMFFMRLLREMKVSQIQADFLDRISHELRTPLATISLVSEILRDSTTSPEEVDQLWSSHDTELARLKRDVELLLQAGHMRDSKLRTNPEAVQLDSWLETKIPEFKSLLGKNAIFNKSGSLGAGVVQLDTALFELILRNLLDNARKFSIQHPEVEIKCQLLSTKHWFGKKRWRIEVIDHGLGFEPDEEDFLFKRFSRIPDQQNSLKQKKIPGTGLGLYLSATASRAMGITLDGKSLGTGKGAQFTLEGSFV